MAAKTMPAFEERLIDRVVIFRSRKRRLRDRWFVSLRSANGQRILTSEGYREMHWAARVAGELADRLGAELIEVES